MLTTAFFSNSTVEHEPADFSFICPNGCSGNGECVEGSTPGEMECACDPGFSGESCATPTNVEHITRSPNDVVDPSSTPADAIKNFLRYAFSGGPVNGTIATLRAVKPEVLAAELQNALDRSEGPVERYAVVYAATMAEHKELLPLYARVLEYEIPSE